VLGSGILIFVTVGAMLPFDRLIQLMDNWTEQHREQDVLAQIGKGDYIPSHMRWTRMLAPGEFREAVRACAIVVAHAGMGSFFVSMEMRRPIVILPRYASRNEVTTDHQLHTVEWLRNRPGVYVAASDDEIAGAIDVALSRGKVEIDNFSRFAPESFSKKIRRFLLQ